MIWRAIQVGEIIPEGYEYKTRGEWFKGGAVVGMKRIGVDFPMRVRVEEPAAPPAEIGYWRELKEGDVVPALYQQRDEFGEWVNHTGTCMVGLKVPEHEPSCALRRVWVEGEAPITSIDRAILALVDEVTGKDREIWSGAPKALLKAIDLIQDNGVLPGDFVCPTCNDKKCPFSLDPDFQCARETPKMVQCGCKKHEFPEGSDPYAAHREYVSANMGGSREFRHFTQMPLHTGIGVSKPAVTVGYDLQDVDGGGV